MSKISFTSENIFKLLEERGISQYELSKRTGIPTSTISDWKRKGNTPTADKVALVCKALQVSPEDILGYASETDYEVLSRVIYSDEPLWELIEMYDKMDKKDQTRLLKYFMALMKAE